MLTLYTIGHSNHKADVFFSLLGQHHITTLVDVRSAPTSRWPHFNKKALENALIELDITYLYMGDTLGGRPQDKTVYIALADGTQALSYPTVMTRDWYQEGIRSLLSLLEEEGSIVIMCSEGNPLECHRHHLIARSLLDPAVKVVDGAITVHHVHRDGKLQEIGPDDFAGPTQGRLL